METKRKRRKKETKKRDEWRGKDSDEKKIRERRENSLTSATEHDLSTGEGKDSPLLRKNGGSTAVVVYQKTRKRVGGAGKRMAGS